MVEGIKESGLVDFCSFSDAEVRDLSTGNDAGRSKVTIPLSKAKKEDILKQQKMVFFEEVLMVLFLACGVPTGVFVIPGITFLVGRFVLNDVALAFKALGLIMLPLTLLPQPFVPSALRSWIAIHFAKYFSFRLLFEERPLAKDLNNPKYRPQIMVAPPHGVFPYGNLLAMIAWPVLNGGNFRGLASSAALRPPIFKQILRSIGVIDASRKVARKALEDGESLGISTGGVAEVFETNSHDECIVLKERVGLIKLAIRTGADIVPCYVFGNTDLLGCWAGEGIPHGRTILETISRKLGFALILIHGRFGLPIPRRLPLLGVVGKPIPTHHLKCEDPTNEQIKKLQDQLLSEMERIFDDYKGLYGWETKSLIIK